MTLRQQLTNFQEPKTSDPVQKLLEIEDHAELMHDAGIKVDDQAVYVPMLLLFPRPNINPKFES